MTSRTASPPHRAAVFVDKDGTLIEDVPYNTNPARVRFTPNALCGLQQLARCNFALFIATNQPGLADGRIAWPAFDALRAHIDQRLRDDAAIVLDGWCVCPHAPASASTVACACRKPAPGLLCGAAAAHDIDLARSWMVGDILDDIEAGRRAGCSTVLLDVGNETVWHVTPQREPHHRCTDLGAAAAWIVAHTPPAAAGLDA
jgi:D-glycero-D-manno-heptose 1,7-bisphosphate phosphatase